MRSLTSERLRGLNEALGTEGLLIHLFGYFLPGLAILDHWMIAIGGLQFKSSH